jgi:hypothetical protein
MAVDHLETEYHLTPDGWLEGTEQFFGEGKAKPIPANGIETWLRKEVQSSRFSAPDVTWRIVWTDGIEPSTNTAVRDKFPAPEHGMGRARKGSYG